jgi:hypothetical protein
MIILNCAGIGCETAIIWALPLGILIGAVSFVIIGVLVHTLIK